tara:strand:- start:19163 stop:20206 length:1044 start_codon:yes stop_codon:yes gene_type:complete
MADEPTETPFEAFETHEVDGAQTSTAEGSQGQETLAPVEAADPDLVAVDEGETNGEAPDAPAPDGDEPVEAAADEPDGADDGADEPVADEPDEGTPKRKNQVSAKERIGALVKERSQAQRDATAATAEAATEKARADALEARIAALETPAEPAAQAAGLAEGEPNQDDYAYGELDPLYISDLTDYRVDQKFAAREEAADKIRQTEAADAQAQKLRDSYDTKVTAGINTYDDFDEVVVKGSDAGDYPLSEETAMMVLESDVGHHLIYKIAGDLDLAKSLAQSSPVEQARVIGRLEAQFSSDGNDISSNLKPTGAPTPPNTRKRGRPAETVDAQSDFAAFEAQHNKAVG